MLECANAAIFRKKYIAKWNLITSSAVWGNRAFFCLVPMEQTEWELPVGNKTAGGDILVLVGGLRGLSSNDLFWDVWFSTDLGMLEHAYNRFVLV